MTLQTRIADETDEQISFRFVLAIEVITVMSHLIAAALYLACSMIGTPEFQLLPSPVADHRVDFLHSQRG